MSLLFFLRSPAGNTDTGQAPDIAPAWSFDELQEERAERRRQRAKLKREAAKAQKLLAKTEEAARARKKRRKDEELLMMLFMHEFDGYDD